MTSLKNEIEKYHPDPYKYITKEKFERFYDSLAQRVVGRYSLRDAYFVFLPMVQAVGCGHTHMSPDRRLLSKNNSLSERPKYFPFSVRYINNQLLVSRNYSAKDNLVELISLNANDPNRGQLAHITLAQGAELQRLAWKQRSPAGTADMLKRAMAFYYQAAKEGLMEESISAIKQCEVSIRDTKVPMEETNTSQPSIELLQPSLAPSVSPSVAHPRKPVEVIIPS